MRILVGVTKSCEHPKRPQGLLQEILVICSSPAENWRMPHEWDPQRRPSKKAFGVSEAVKYHLATLNVPHNDRIYIYIYIHIYIYV